MTKNDLIMTYLDACLDVDIQAIPSNTFACSLSHLGHTGADTGFPKGGGGDPGYC